MSNHLKVKDIWVSTSGKGETQTEAIEAAFKEMRKNLGTQITEPVVAIRTNDVKLTNVVKEERQEAFLFFFMKRTRETWHVDAEINLEIDYIDFEGSTRNHV